MELPHVMLMGAFGIWIACLSPVMDVLSSLSGLSADRVVWGDGKVHGADFRPTRRLAS